MLSNLKRCQTTSTHAQTNIMFKLYWARVPAADLNGPIHHHSIAQPTSPARLMPFIVRAFLLFVAGRVALAGTAAPTGKIAPLAAAS
jgi:hypothetical protein